MSFIVNSGQEMLCISPKDSKKIEVDHTFRAW